jgi:hypothetical protein
MIPFKGRVAALHGCSTPVLLRMSRCPRARPAQSWSAPRISTLAPARAMYWRDRRCRSFSITSIITAPCARFAARQNRPGSARENGSRLRIRISRFALERRPLEGALGRACERGRAWWHAGTGLPGSPRVRGCPSIPASLPPARCAGRGQGSRSDGPGRLALTPPRIPGTHGLPRDARRRRPWNGVGRLSPAAREERGRRFGQCGSGDGDG